MRTKCTSRKEELQLSLVFLFFILMALGGIVIYRHSILNNSILEYEVLNYIKQVGRSTNSIMEINYNGTSTDISISKESYESLDRGIEPLVFYNSEFDDPFTFLHLILFTKFLGCIFILAGFVGIIFLLINWRFKSKMKKVLMISWVLLFGLLGYYFISFESKKIQAKTIAFSLESSNTLFSSFEEDSIIHWKKNILPGTYQYEGVYQTFHYPDLFFGNHTFLAEIMEYEEIQFDGQKKLFYGRIWSSNGSQTMELDSKEIVDILIDDGSIQKRMKCSGGFFCIELPVSKSVDVRFSLDGYITKQVSVFFSDSTDIDLANGNCVFKLGEGVEKVDLEF